MLKKTKSNIKKKIGRRFPSNLHFLSITKAFLKDIGKTEVRGKGGWGALAHKESAIVLSKFPHPEYNLSP